MTCVVLPCWPTERNSVTRPTSSALVRRALLVDRANLFGWNRPTGERCLGSDRSWPAGRSRARCRHDDCESSRAVVGNGSGRPANVHPWGAWVELVGRTEMYTNTGRCSGNDPSLASPGRALPSLAPPCTALPSTASPSASGSGVEPLLRPSGQPFSQPCHAAPCLAGHRPASPRRACCPRESNPRCDHRSYHSPSHAAHRRALPRRATPCQATPCRACCPRESNPRYDHRSHHSPSLAQPRPALPSHALPCRATPRPASSR
jgi:hypothetical protein